MDIAKDSVKAEKGVLPPIARLTEAWIDNGMSNKEIEEKLLFGGYDEKYVAGLLKELTKLRNAKKTTRGLVFILIGAALCLLSCILTLSQAFSGSDFSFVLFGLTTLGILLVFGGLVFIFG